MDWGTVPAVTQLGGFRVPLNPPYEAFAFLR
jgi:hypothetical protein